MDIPLFLDLAAERGEGEVGITQWLSNANGFAYAGSAVIDAFFFGIFNEFKDERRDRDERIWFKAADGIPLQFRHPVADADDAGTELSYPEEISQPGHKPPVDGGHELVGVVFAAVGYGKGDAFVIGQAVEVAVGHGKCNRVAQGAGRGDIIDDLNSRHTNESVILLLQVVFGSRRDVYQVFEMF